MVLVPHAVSYDAERGVWVCDIPVDPGNAYMPFVRLAVARYQASSLTGLEVSAAVELPFIQILPDRQVTVNGDGPDRYTLTVEGQSYLASGVQPPPDPALLFPGAVNQPPTRAAPVPYLIDVTVQERLAGTTDEAGWGASGSPVELQSAATGDGLKGVAPGAPLWSGAVTLAADRSPGQFRILITEYELLDSDRNLELLANIETDDDDLGRDGDHTATVFQWNADWYRPGSRRLVFAAEIII